MVEYGQYPLVLQLENGIPVGLAESTGNFSGVNLVVSSVSATTYLGLTGTGSITIPLPINQGGTAATSIADAQLNLSLRPGYEVQGYSTGLAAIAALPVTDSTFIVGNGSTWVSESDTTVRASLGLTIGTHVQAWNNNLDDISVLTPANNYFLVGDGTDWKAESPADARTSLGLGSLATATTPISIADGGTGATTNTNARSNLGLGTADNPQFATLEIGHATDTTLARSSAGNLTIEGNVIYRLNGTDVAVADGGTGASTESQARINLGLSALATASSVNLSTQVTNTLPITNGGTGQTTANAALNALLPSQSTNSGKYLQTDGTNTSWATAAGGSWTSVFRTTDQTVTGLTETTDNTLSFSIGASENYSFRAYINFDETGGGYSLSVSSGASSHWSLEYFDNSNRSYTLNAGAGTGGAFIASETIMSDLAGPSKGAIKINGLLTNSGTATGLLIKFASNNATKAATNKAGSHLEYKKL